ncbi:S-adenosyl-L-methionine-dependent methyltransferase [Syncephalis plumigaleata]|nr:S-adenosyl-L-methionine-dependent methyltransferase [Syncephalis plumigaleata]
MCVALIESRKNLSTRDQLVQQLLRYVTRRDYAAPLENPHKILDIGAKDGAWIKDMSKQFPTCKIRGCEGFLLSDKKTSPLPHNCRIDLVNLCRRFPYGDNNFDYIHQRMMSFYTPVEVWAYRASEIFRMLRPGGYVEFVELDHDLIRPGPSAVTIHDWIREKLLLQGIDLTVVRHIDQLLQMAGFTDIHRHTIEIPMGPWGLVRGQVTMRLVSLIYSSVHQALLEGSNEPIVSRSLSHESEGELLNNMNSPMLDNDELDNRQKVSLDLEDHVN